MHSTILELLNEFDVPYLPDGRRRPNREDLSGQKFGNLTAVRFHHKKNGSITYWEFNCDCGNATISRASHVKNGTIVSCGCARGKKRDPRAPLTHTQKMGDERRKKAAMRHPERWRERFLRLWDKASSDNREWALAHVAAARKVMD